MTTPSCSKAGSCPKPVIGLVGGIGSGKSQVAQLLAGYGGRVIRGDALGHEGLTQPDIQDKIRNRWGSDLLNSSRGVDRQKLASIVFADPVERQALEGMLFPYIEARIRAELVEAQADPTVRLVILDAAIMLETGWDVVCDHLLFIDAPRDQRLNRVRQTRGWDAAELERREAVQMPLAEKARRADGVLSNSGSLEELRHGLEAWLRVWQLESIHTPC